MNHTHPTHALICPKHKPNNKLSKNGSKHGNSSFQEISISISLYLCMHVLLVNTRIHTHTRTDERRSSPQLWLRLRKMNRPRRTSKSLVRGLRKPATPGLLWMAVSASGLVLRGLRVMKITRPRFSSCFERLWMLWNIMWSISAWPASCVFVLFKTDGLEFRVYIYIYIICIISHTYINRFWVHHVLRVHVCKWFMPDGIFLSQCACRRTRVYVCFRNVYLKLTIHLAHACVCMPTWCIP